MKYTDYRCSVGQVASWGSLLAAGILALTPTSSSSAALDAEALKVVLEVLAESEKALSNSDGGASFACQRVYMQARKGKQQGEVKNFRRFVDWRPSGGTAFLAGYPNVPTEVVARNYLLLFQVPKNGWVFADNLQWEFEFSGSEYQACLVYGRTRAPKPPSIVFAPESFSTFVLGFANKQCNWDHASRTLTAVGENGDSLMVRLRSDLDTTNYNSRLSAILARTSEGAVLGMLCPCVAEVNYARLSSIDPQQLVRDLAAEPVPPGAKQLPIHFGGMSQEAVTTAELSWRLLLKDRMEFDELESDAVDDLIQAQVTLENVCEFALEKLLIDRGEQPSDDALADLNLSATLLAEAIEDWTDASVGVVEADSTLFPDDPQMRWLRTEYLQGPDSALLAYTQILKRTISDPALTPLSRTKLLVSASALGACLFERPEHSLDASLDNPFEQAVVRARLSMPCNKKQRDACVSVVEDEKASIEMRSIAAVTLSLLDSAGAVPEELVGSWIEHDVETLESPRRRRRLAEISSHSSGVQLLHEQLQKNRFDKGRDDVLFVLALRKRASSITLLPPPLTPQH